MFIWKTKQHPNKQQNITKKILSETPTSKPPCF